MLFVENLATVKLHFAVAFVLLHLIVKEICSILTNTFLVFVILTPLFYIRLLQFLSVVNLFALHYSGCRLQAVPIMPAMTPITADSRMIRIGWNFLNASTTATAKIPSET